MNRKVLAWSVAVLALLAAGAGTVYAVAFAASETRTVRVQTRDVEEFIVASGRLRAQTSSDLGTDVSGVVDTVKVRAGDEVERGDLLVTLRPADAKAAIDQQRAALQTRQRELQRLRAAPTKAEIASAQSDVSRAQAALDQARAEYQRAKALLDNGVGTPAEASAAKTRQEQSKADLERAKSQLDLLQQGAKPAEIRVARSQLEQAKVALDASESNLEKYTVLAAFGGLITDVEANPGESVTFGSPLVTLARMSDAEIYVEVDEDYLDDLNPGQTARVFFRSQPQAEFEATVRQIGPEADIERGIVGLHLDPNELPNGAFPGLSADVSIQIALHENATAVPITAIATPSDSGPYVLVVRDSTAHKQSVELVGEGAVWAAIRGVEADTVIVLDAAKTEVGARVDPKEVPADELDSIRTGKP